MGISAMKCDGYSAVGETRLGNGLESASDFNVNNNLLKGVAILALGVAVEGCAEKNVAPNLALDKVDYDKNSSPIAAGTAVGPYSLSDSPGSGYAESGKLVINQFLETRNDLETGQTIVIRPFSGGNETAACRVVSHPSVWSYEMNCVGDVFREGTPVAAYRGYALKE